MIASIAAGRRRIATAATALLAAFALAACGAPSPGENEQPSGPPQQGGSLVYSFNLESRGLDPVVASAVVNTDATQMTAIYDGLVLPDPTTGEPRPRLAESMESDEAGQVWTMTLREGLTFTDGTPLDAAAVAFNVDRHADPATRSIHAAVTRGISATAVDARTVEFALAAPNRAFDSLLAGSALNFIGSPTAIRADPQGFADAPVGAGPFMVREWIRDDRLVLVRNPDYWDAPRPYLDEIEIRIVPDQTAAFNSVVAGEIDMFAAGNQLLFEQVPGVGLRSSQYAVNGGYTVDFNTRRAPFDDPRARRAVALALDREDLVAIINGAPSTNIVRENAPFYTPQAAQPAGNRQEAQALFDQLAAEGRPVSFAMTIPSVGAARPLTEAMQAQLQTFGNVEMGIDLVDSVRFQAVTRVTLEFQSTQANLVFDDPEPEVWNKYHTEGLNNFTGYSNPVVDAALESARSAGSDDERYAAYEQVFTQIATDLPDYVFAMNPLGAIYTDEVTGVTFFGDGRILLSELGLATEPS